MTLRIAALVLTYLAAGFADAARGLSSLPSGAVLPPGAAMGALGWMGVLAAVLVALPAGVLAAKTGKKSTILLGLCIAMVGDLVPVLAGSRAGDLLLATFLVGAGLTAAQVGGAAIARDAAGASRWPAWLLVAFAALHAGPALVPPAAALVGSLGWHWTALFGGFTIVVVIGFSAMVIGRIDERFECEAPIGAVFADAARTALQPRMLLFLLAVAAAAGEAGALHAPSRHPAAVLVLLLAAAATLVLSARVVLQATAALGVAAGAVLLFSSSGPVGLAGTIALSVAGGSLAAAVPLALVLLLQAQPGRTTLAAGLTFAAAATGTACGGVLSFLQAGPAMAGVLLLLVSLWPPLTGAPSPAAAAAEGR